MIGGGKGLSPKDAKLFKKHLKKIKEGGVFYLIQLLPECYPNRVKFGFAHFIERRLSEHQITCPNAKLLGNWNCLRSREKDIIKQITKICNCVGLTTEVFDCEDYKEILNKTEELFK
jgi:5'-deoxynucleotidase YfbR-like HD superfamily hydrolase